jgi:hypothetical protein
MPLRAKRNPKSQNRWNVHFWRLAQHPDPLSLSIAIVMVFSPASAG